MAAAVIDQRDVMGFGKPWSGQSAAQAVATRVTSKTTAYLQAFRNDFTVYQDHKKYHSYDDSVRVTESAIRAQRRSSALFVEGMTVYARHRLTQHGGSEAALQAAEKFVLHAMPRGGDEKIAGLLRSPHGIAHALYGRQPVVALHPIVRDDEWRVMQVLNAAFPLRDDVSLIETVEDSSVQRFLFDAGKLRQLIANDPAYAHRMLGEGDDAAKRDRILKLLVSLERHLRDDLSIEDYEIDIERTGYLFGCSRHDCFLFAKMQGFSRCGDKPRAEALSYATQLMYHREQEANAGLEFKCPAQIRWDTESGNAHLQAQIAVSRALTEEMNGLNDTQIASTAMRRLFVVPDDAVLFWG